MRFWKISYKVITDLTSPASTARNTRALSIGDLRTNVKVTNVHNEQYAILDDISPVQVSKTFGIVLSHKVYEADTAWVLDAVIEAVAANLDGK